MDEGCVENSYVHVALVQQHADFCTSEDQTVRARIAQAGRDTHKLSFAALGGDVFAKLFINNAMRGCSVRIVGQDRLKTGAPKTPRVKVLLHRESRCHETGTSQPRIMNCGGGCIGDVKQRDGEAIHHLVSKLVHRVGRKDQDIGTATLKRFSLVIQDFSGFLPIAFCLKRFNLGKIQRANEELGGMQPAETLSG